jgi:hypothetical protein
MVAPRTRLTRRQRIALAALAELHREADALHRRIQRHVVTLYAQQAARKIAAAAFASGGAR